MISQIIDEILLAIGSFAYHSLTIFNSSAIKYEKREDNRIIQNRIKAKCTDSVKVNIPFSVRIKI